MKRDDTILSTTLARGKKGGNKSSALRVVEQARTRAAIAGKVTTIDSERLEAGIDETGKPSLTAIFPMKVGKPHRVDISYMLDFPELMDLFASGFLAWGRVNGQETRLSGSALLRGHWFRYLQQSGLSRIAVVEIDEQFLVGFNQWLHGRTCLTRTNTPTLQPLHPNTIRKALGAVRTLFGASTEMRFLAERMPAGPRGAARKTNPTEVLTQAQLVAIWAAAEKETLAIRDRWVRGRALLEQGLQALAAGRSLMTNVHNHAAKCDANLAVCLAVLATTYPGVLPHLKVIKEHNRLLGDTVDKAFSHSATMGYFFPSARDLVPLVLLITLATAFNPETVLKLTWKNINRNVDRLGTPSVAFDRTDEGEHEREKAAEPDAVDPLLKIKGDKPRSRRQLLRLLDPTAADSSQASLNLVLDLLREMTDRIRPFVLPEHADRLFVYVPAQGSKRIPKGFGGGSSDRAAEMSWGDSLANFVQKNDLAPFALTTLRATLLDFVQLVNGGDLERARQVGNHTSRVITWTHYTSDLVRRLLKEATGEILLTRDRWIDTDGVIDPRRTSTNADKACATPGFGCFDPFDSPRPNQKAGRLCDAFGECPDCPLAISSPGNPVDVAWWEALQRAIYRSVGTMTANVWQERWTPVASANRALIAIVPAEVLTKARRFRVELPNVG